MKISVYIPDDKKDVYLRAKELLELEGGSVSSFLLRKLEEYLKMQGWKGNPELEKKVEDYIGDYLRVAWGDKAVEKRPKFQRDKKIISPDFVFYKDSNKNIIDALVDVFLDLSDEEAEVVFRDKLKDYFPFALEKQITWYLLPILYADGNDLKLRKMLTYNFKTLKKDEEYPHSIESAYKENYNKEIEEIEI